MEINKKKIVVFGSVILSGILLIAVGWKMDQKQAENQKGEIHFYDKEEKEFAVVRMNVSGGSMDYDCQDEFLSYADTAYQEAVDQIMDQEQCSREDALVLIGKNNWKIHTTLDTNIQKLLYDEVTDQEAFIRNGFGMAINDTAGHVLACMSYGEEKNYVLNHTYAGSSMKPLSVYGPAIENGTINWSTMVEDAPYNTVTDASGETRDWPANTAPYTYEACTAADGLKKSLNTLAVRILKQYGVENSCDFLEDKLGVKLDKEREIMKEQGEDEILGNIALGYLRNGISVKEMAGFYQVFANGGTYVPSHTVMRIEKNADMYYENEEIMSTVFTNQTSYIMNRMMKRVLEDGGTAHGAYMDGYDIVGKTGTSDNNADNWFIGCTPEYVCAIWYGRTPENLMVEKKVSFQLYDDIITKIEKEGDEFRQPENIETQIICSKSGQLAGDCCTDTMTGYYKPGTELDICQE